LKIPELERKMVRIIGKPMTKSLTRIIYQRALGPKNLTVEMHHVRKVLRNQSAVMTISIMFRQLSPSGGVFQIMADPKMDAIIIGKMDKIRRKSRLRSFDSVL
jgi:hypothetical protein